MLLDDMIREGDYVKVTRGDVHDNISKGDYVYCVGNRAVNEDADDLYNLRLKLIVLTLEDGGKHSSLETGGNLYYVDAKSLKKASKKKQKELDKINKED